MNLDLENTAPNRDSEGMASNSEGKALWHCQGMWMLWWLVDVGLVECWNNMTQPGQRRPFPFLLCVGLGPRGCHYTAGGSTCRKTCLSRSCLKGSFGIVFKPRESASPFLSKIGAQTTSTDFWYLTKIGVLFVVVACFSHVPPRSTPKQTKNSSRKLHIVSP